MISLLSITDLHVSVANTEIVRGLNLEMNESEVHAIMGPNGSGKSTLVNALMGHPAYTITGGSVLFRGEDILAMEPHERAQAGLFLAFQYPKEISGVSLRSFLLAAHRAQVAAHPEMKRLSPLQFQKVLAAEMEKLQMNPAFADRSINQGFSGGEKKKAEILQMAILAPVLALMDETDSGLDVDALKIVASGVNRLRGDRRSAVRGPEALRPEWEIGDQEKENNSQFSILNSQFSALIVTHYARILDYITPDKVHVMVKGKIVKSGGAEFARQLEKEGYAQFGGEASVAIPLEI